MGITILKAKWSYYPSPAKEWAKSSWVSTTEGEASTVSGPQPIKPNLIHVITFYRKHQSQNELTADDSHEKRSRVLQYRKSRFNVYRHENAHQAGQFVQRRQSSRLVYNSTIVAENTNNNNRLKKQNVKHPKCSGPWPLHNELGISVLLQKWKNRWKIRLLLFSTQNFLQI